MLIRNKIVLTNGLVHDPCTHPGKTWHSLHVGPAHPNLQRHSFGTSQYPRVEWQSSRQIAEKKMIYLNNIFTHFNHFFRSINFYYDQYRRVHPILYCKYIRRIHYNNHVDSPAMEYIDHIYHHKNLDYNDIHQVFCSIHALDHILFDKLEHHINLLAIL